ncbi:RHS repeat-associated core domain-containing protein [Arenimonas terrae]|uniref:RHS repeat-associated core domain-containing protein n=2 Tax=Arenimonas terrae TaxID=2546226 RepID=A0A5C4RX59_9GAMM|nr:RHS repeat-associated core domain-containing protein [Arenimonas terrae]
MQQTEAGVSSYFVYGQAGQLLFSQDGVNRYNHIHLAGSLVAKRLVPFSGTTSIRYQHTNALGSPVAETNEAGALAQPRERLTAYGEPADGTWQAGPGFTGHQMDASSKLVYMQQRYYDPVVGRFLSADPMISDTQNGWNFNRNSYAANNPYRFVDPDGRRISGLTCGMFCEKLRQAWGEMKKRQEELVRIVSSGHKTAEDAAIAFGEDTAEKAKEDSSEPNAGIVEIGSENFGYTNPIWGAKGETIVQMREYSEALKAVHGLKLRGLVHTHFDRNLRFSPDDVRGMGNWTYFMRNQAGQVRLLNKAILKRERFEDRGRETLIITSKGLAELKAHASMEIANHEGSSIFSFDSDRRRLRYSFGWARRSRRFAVDGKDCRER